MGEARKRLVLGTCLSAAIIILGVVAGIVRIQIEDDLWIIYRWLTVAGNAFAVLTCIPFLAVSCHSLAKRKPLRLHVLFYLQLSAATTELIVLIASVLAYLPIIPQDGAEGTLDMVLMHFIVPLLTVALFIFCCPRPTKASRISGFWGLAYLVIYSAGLIASIVSGALPSYLIPYFFLDLESQPAWIPVFFAIIVFGLAYLLSRILGKANERAGDLR